MLYKYEVSFFEEIEGKMMTARGFVSGVNISEAAEEVASFYGDPKEEVEYIKISTLDENSLHEVECVTNS